MKKSTKIAAIILGLLTVVVLILLVVTQPKKSQETEPSPSPIAQQRLGQVLPGTASQEDVFAKLGQPLETKEADDLTVLSYPSYNQYNPNEVTVVDSQVSFIREKLYDAPNASLKSRLESLGEDYVELYGPDTNSGVMLFTYPKKGIAFLANPIGDVIYEVWYFTKGSLAQTLQLPEFADYSTQEYYSEEL